MPRDNRVEPVHVVERGLEALAHAPTQDVEAPAKLTLEIPLPRARPRRPMIARERVERRLETRSSLTDATPSRVDV